MGENQRRNFSWAIAFVRWKQISHHKGHGGEATLLQEQSQCQVWGPLRVQLQHTASGSGLRGRDHTLPCPSSAAGVTPYLSPVLVHFLPTSFCPPVPLLPLLTHATTFFTSVKHEFILLSLEEQGLRSPQSLPVFLAELGER